jgi:hypothetical protein
LKGGGENIADSPSCARVTSRMNMIATGVVTKKTAHSPKKSSTEAVSCSWAAVDILRVVLASKQKSAAGSGLRPQA